MIFSADKFSPWKSVLFYSLLSLGISPSLCLNTAKMAVLAAHMLRGTRKLVETVHSGPRKHTERFGCNSHIGQLNATTSALSLPFAYGIHMLMMSLVFFFLHVCMCMCVCVCAVCFSLVYFFFLPVLPRLLPFSLYRQTKRDAENLDSYFLFWKKKKPTKKNPDTPVLFSLPLAWRLKGRLDECHSCSIAVPLISTRSPFNSREGKALSLPRAA